MASTPDDKSIAQEADKLCPSCTSPMRDWWFSHYVRDELNKFANKEWVKLYTGNEIKGTIFASTSAATSLIIMTVVAATGMLFSKYNRTQSSLQSTIQSSLQSTIRHEMQKAFKANGHNKNGTPNGQPPPKDNNGKFASKQTPPKNGESGQ